MKFMIFSILVLYCVDTIESNSKLTGIRKFIASLNNEIKLLKLRNEALSAYCELRVKGKCGPCICVDDFDTPKKYYCDCTNQKPKRDCLSFYQYGLRVDGIYNITMKGIKNMLVYCDQTTQGGGWTVIQRRYDGSTNFYRNWKEYKEGFGKLYREFWIGNENIYLLSAQAITPKGSEALIQMRSSPNGYFFTNRYSHFHVDNEVSKYKVHVSGYSGGNCPSCFTSYNSNAKFSTKDQDNDQTSSYHCARTYYGGWWYKSCNVAQTNLNGEYDQLNKRSWYYSFSWSGYHLDHSEMKMRRLV